MLEVAAGKTLEEFQNDRLLYPAVERNFEIVGEAISRLSRVDSETAAKIDDYPQVIAFRNILIHGYDIIDRRIVWSVIHGNLPELHDQVCRLLGETHGAH